MPEGKGSRYQTTYKDADGDYLDGRKVYKLTMPPKVPVALFWSVTVYDPWTRCELQSQPYPSISEPAEAGTEDQRRRLHRRVLLRREAGGRLREQNWIRTLPDRGFFVYIRYYGPLKAFNDKSWVPNDVELVE
jgi:hypothetical protein